jgi:hypothetical protein
VGRPHRFEPRRNERNAAGKPKVKLVKLLLTFWRGAFQLGGLAGDDPLVVRGLTLAGQIASRRKSKLSREHRHAPLKRYYAPRKRTIKPESLSPCSVKGCLDRPGYIHTLQMMMHVVAPSNRGVVCRSVHQHVYRSSIPLKSAVYRVARQPWDGRPQVRAQAVEQGT